MLSQISSRDEIDRLRSALHLCQIRFEGISLNHVHHGRQEQAETVKSWANEIRDVLSK